MIRFNKVIIFTICSLLAGIANAKPSAYVAQQLFEAGVEARKQQQFELAQTKLEAAREVFPDNSDIYVQLGYTYFALGKLDEAEASFKQALIIAPHYVDANYGLIQVALAQDRLPHAESMLTEYLNEHQDDERFLALRERVQAIKDSIRNWRLDVHGYHSRLSQPYADWNELEVALSYKVTADTAITGTFIQSHRFGLNDQKIGATLWHTFNSRFYGYTHGMFSPTKEFFPNYTFATGGNLTVLDAYNEDRGSFHITLDLKFDNYSNGDVKTVSPGIEQFFLADRLAFSAKWINTFDQKNKYVDGYMVKMNAVPRDDLRVFIGYSDALETSDKLLIRTKAFFTGLTYDITNTFSVGADYAHENRDNSYNRQIFGVGFTWLF